MLYTTGRIDPEPDTSIPMVNREGGDIAVEATTGSVHAKIGDFPHADNAVVQGMDTHAEQAAINDKLQQQVAAMMRHMELHNIMTSSELHNLMTSSPSPQVSSPTGNTAKQYKQHVSFFLYEREREKETCL